MVLAPAEHYLTLIFTLKMSSSVFTVEILTHFSIELLLKVLVKVCSKLLCFLVFNGRHLGEDSIH